MWWLFLWVGLASAGLAVLTAAAVPVFAAVRELARQVAVSTEALSAAGERLQRAAGPVAERAGDISRR
jgi:DNA-binding IclR family transcriptional regulator